MLDRSDAGLWAVADGMGGHSAGDVAASIAVDALAAMDTPIDATAVQSALEMANRRILASRGGSTSGTTIVALWIVGLAATVFWAGDSRAYLIRDGDVRALTHDHSLVQELIDAGAITPFQADYHPQSNVITRALGIAAEVAIDTVAVALAPGDRLLLCTDGLHRTLDGRDFDPSASIDDQADRLLTHALQRDGSDNVSLVLVEIG